MQAKEMEMGMANGDTASSVAVEVDGNKPSEKKWFASGALAFLGGIKTSTFASTLSRHFNNCLPPQRKYLNNRINRRTLLIIIGITFLSLLALIIGLAVGLTTGSQNNIPAKPDGATDVTGDFTYYSTGLGACGVTNNDNDAIVSISHGRFDENMVDGNPNNNKLCGRKIRAHRIDERTGKEASIDLTIADRCVGCAYNDIDVSPVYFGKMAAHDLGRVKVQWYFLKWNIKHLVPKDDQHSLPDHSPEPSTAQTPKPPPISTHPFNTANRYSDVFSLAESDYSSGSYHNKPLPSRPQAHAQQEEDPIPGQQGASWYPSADHAEYSSVVEEDIRQQSREGSTLGSPDRKKRLDLKGKGKGKELLDKQSVPEPAFLYSGHEAFESIDINEPSVQRVVEPPSEMHEKTVKKKVLNCGLGIFMVLVVIALVLLSIYTSGALGSNGLKDLFKASNLSSTTSITPIVSSMIASTPVVSTVMVPSPETDVASTVPMTSILDPRTTASQSSTPSPKTMSNSVKSALLSAASSAPVSQLASTMDIEDDLIGRSGYIGLRDEAFNGHLILNRAQKAIVAGEPSIAYANEEEKREDECTTTTITTTLTATTTSTLHTSRLAVASAEIHAPSMQPAGAEPEPESSNVSPTNKSPTLQRDESTSDSAVSQSATQVGFNLLESTYATLSQTPDPTPTRPPSTTQTAQSRNTDASVLSASSIAAGARLGISSWDTFQRLRRFSPLNPSGEENRHIPPFITPVPTATTNDEIRSRPDETGITLLSTSNDNAAARRGLDLPPFADLLSQALDLTTKVHLPTMIDLKSKESATKQPVHTPSSNAAAPRHAAPWRRVTFMPTNPHRRRQATQTPSHIPRHTYVPAYPHIQRQNSSASPSPNSLGRKLTFWEAFSQLRLQAVQMCFDVKTYQDSTLTPVQEPKDLQMGKALDEKICSMLDQSFPPVTQGGKCDTKSEWEILESKVGEVCSLQKMGEKLVQDVENLCGVKDVYASNLDTCGSKVSGIGSAVAGGASNLSASSSGSLAAESTAGSSKITTATYPKSLSVTLQQHGITSPTPGPTVPSTASTPTNAPLLTSTNALSPTLGTSPGTIAAGCPAIPETPVPSSCIGTLPSHPKLTPSPDWTIPLLTYSIQAASYTSLRTIPANAVATPPKYTGPQISRDWPVSYAFPIPTGYVAPNIVPASPQIGQLTYFNPGLGACAQPEMASNELAVAISWELFDMGREIGNSSLAKDWVTKGTVGADGIDRAGSVFCNQGIKAWIGDGGGGKGVEMEFVVRDRCEGCNVSDIDIQPDVFDKYWGTRERGRVMVTWEWMREAPTDMPK
ncbi:hypothetical protein PTMSG1_05133 [Pyrenophora teres f. maculata]|nr:hypothetical protein PTMSG1_05133 [Pyrenophora teres f. maculata]